jgi:hypothetical protein
MCLPPSLQVFATQLGSPMPQFRHASFVSYRHGQLAIKQAFVQQLTAGLSAELEVLRNEKLYVDTRRLNGGDFFHQELGRALYESATMILVYQPNYFDADHPYCAREYRAMCCLERERLALLPNAEDRNHSLIIPVVLRGEKELPAELRDKRQYHDFSTFALVGRELARNREYAPKLRAIAEYINERCKALEANRVPFADADAFRFPGEEEVCPWIQGLQLLRPKFPTAEGVR